MSSVYTLEHLGEAGGGNGLGDRLSQAVDGITTTYTLDLNPGLTQVLADGTNTYLYGNGRIAQVGATAEYFPRGCAPDRYCVAISS